MRGIVVALAGLTCGEGGPGMGAARAPVEEPLPANFRFDGAWYGQWQMGGHVRSVVLLWSSLFDAKDRLGRSFGTRCAIEPTGTGAVRVRYDNQVLLGIARRGDGGQVIVCFALRPGTRPVSFRPDEHIILLTLTRKR
jgi:hypothetical protein